VYRAAQTLPLSQVIAVHRALGLLLVRALRQRARVIDVTGLTLLNTRPRWAATILAVTDQQITVEVDGGVVTTVPSVHFAWPGQPPPPLAPGGTVEVHVTDVMPERGRVLLTLRDPAKDPMARVTVGDVLAGQVVRVDRAGLRVVVTDVGLEVFVPARETLTRRDLDAAFPLNSTVRLRLTEVNTERRNLVGSRVFHRAETRLPDTIAQLIQAPGGGLPRLDATQRAVFGLGDDQGPPRRVRRAEQRREPHPDPPPRVLVEPSSVPGGGPRRTVRGARRVKRPLLKDSWCAYRRRDTGRQTWETAMFRQTAAHQTQHSVLCGPVVMLESWRPTGLDREANLGRWRL
jgi:hypothetical protein